MDRKHSRKAEGRAWVDLDESQLALVQGGTRPGSLQFVMADGSVRSSIKVTSYSINGSGLDDGAVPTS